jgi:hypothetical protein
MGGGCANVIDSAEMQNALRWGRARSRADPEAAFLETAENDLRNRLRNLAVVRRDQVPLLRGEERVEATVVFRDLPSARSRARAAQISSGGRSTM